MNWIVIGGGFKGIISAILLRRHGCDVTLVDQAPYLGGLLYGDEWEGFYIDRGAHLFDNVDDSITELMHEILGDDITPVDVRYAAVMEDRKVDGVAVPDFTSLSELQQQGALFELLRAAARPDNGDAPKTLSDLFEQRFGPTLSRLLAGPTRKMLRNDPEKLAPETMITTPFRRIRFLPDGMTEMLKRIPELDERIALPVSNDPLRHYHDTVSIYPHRNYYPTKKGMRGFCEGAKTYLEKIGVRLMLGTAIETVSSNSTGKITAQIAGGESLVADKLLWASPVAGLGITLFEENPFKGWASPIPMLLYYFAVSEDRVGPYEYMHDFSEQHLLFRPSAIGRHGGQIKADGTTYVCLEAVTDYDAPVWEDPQHGVERIWNEAVDLNVVSGAIPDTRMVHKLPATYVPAKPGLEDRKREFYDRIAEEYGDTVLALDQHAFSKIDIQNAIEMWLK